MNGVILTTHGSFASGLYQTIKMIAGEFDNLAIVEFKENDTLEAMDQRLLAAYNKFSTYDNILVLTDLAGGTPFNRSVITLSNKENVRFLAGLNFAMLYQALTSEESQMDTYVNEVLETSKESIILYKADKKEDRDDFEDGI
ncbi:MAG: PTS sugar transporter subunit IIA [Peptoniphilaceae bacterium]|nr:PTS sugar transporter subunit IIA [Peptoniphilaceae bacterium]MDY6019007.1 PTS sugar transporter subunit IIA [Anaerococcus sp.]